MHFGLKTGVIPRKQVFGGAQIPPGEGAILRHFQPIEMHIGTTAKQAATVWACVAKRR